MALEKCPRCELNYILDGGELCTVCRSDISGDFELNELTELCSECGEYPAVSGSELCIYCLKELSRSSSNSDDTIVQVEPITESDSVSTMEEIALDLDDGMGEAFGDEDEEEEVEDDDGMMSIDALSEREVEEADDSDDMD